MDNGQRIYKNTILTHNLCSKQAQKPNHNLHSNQPRTISTLSMTAGLPNIRLCF